MKLIFERSRPGRGNDLLPSLDVPAAPLPCLLYTSDAADE